MDYRTIKIILDTSALLDMLKFKLNIDYELEGIYGRYEMLVPSTVINELKAMGRKRYARAALSFAERCEEVPSREQNADKAIIELAVKLNCVVLTDDKELKRELEKSGISILSVHNRKLLPNIAES